MRNELALAHEKVKAEIEKVSRKLQDDLRNLQELDKIIGNTSNAFDKILENTKTLYSILKKDEAALVIKKEKSGKIL